MMKRCFTLFAISVALLFSTSCEKDIKEDNTGDTPNEAVIIDGDFSDWHNMDATSGVVIAKNSQNSLWDGVKEIRCIASKDYVYYYIKYDKDTLDEQMEKLDPLHIRLCINTDGEFTSGYNSYFLEAYDFIIEGSLAGEGVWKEFDGGLSQRTFVEAKGKIDWLSLLSSGKGLVAGKGNSSEYEISLKRELFNSSVAQSTDPNKPIGKVFHTGIRFYCNGWSELSNMPNSSADEAEGKGWGNLMEVTTIQ